MIAKVTRGSGFAGLVRYLETGKDGASPDRVDWVEARNLPSDDPQTAGILMRATAHQSDRVEKPVYHVSISFDHGDPVDRATISRVANQVLTDLGLEEHQVLMVAHRDKEHAHVHLAINRVHPETGRAWDPRHDYARVEQSLRRQERELGLREVPGHHHQLTGQHPPERSDALTSGQLRRWERTGHLPFDELVRTTAGREFLEAKSWDDLEGRLARHGLHLEPRGRGLVITDGAEVVKASSVAPGASRNKLEQRFGVMYADYRRDREPEFFGEPAPTPEAGQRTAERPGLGRDGGEADHPASKSDRDGRTTDRSAGRDRGPEREAVGRDHRRRAPDRARDDGRDDTSRRAPAEHGRRRAERDVSGREVEAAGGPRAVDADERHSSGARGRSAGRDRGRTGDAEVDALNGLIAKLERRIELEKARGPAVGELERAETRLRPLEFERREAHKAAAEFNDALDRMYVDGIGARRTIRGFAQQEGIGAAMREIASRPDRFGEIRGTERGPLRSSERKEVQRRAVELSRAGDRYFHRVDVARTLVADHRDARTAVSRAEGKLRTIDIELSKGPGAARLRLQIHERARALQPNQKQEVSLRLSPSQRLMLGTSLAVGMAFVRDRGHER